MATVSVDLSMAPYQVADETFVIPWVLQAPPVGLFPMNSLVIRGEQPMIVDTGAPANREQWIKDVASIVDLDDVRWIFLSHDDRDHSGNLLPALEACPNARLLTTWFSVGRMFEEWATPLDRCHFLNDGDRIEVGDRTLSAIRPPIFDNPTSRALFDEHTGVFWSVDTFATNVAEPLQDAADLADNDFEDGQLLGSRLVAAWHPWLDDQKFCTHVDAVESLPISVIAGCHTPAIYGSRISTAFELLRRVPTSEPWTEFTQADLEQWMAAMPEPTSS
jgi:flavorubredoxin